MRFLYTALAALAISIGAAGGAMADDITADVLTYDGNTKVVTAKGDVVIHANQGATITASQGEYHFEDRSSYLEGGVHYVKEATTLDAAKMYLYQDKTARGIGSVNFHDGAENRTLKGDDVMYNPDTGFGKIEGNGYLSSPDGTLEAPHIEGNMKQVKVVATGGVNLSSSLHNAVGYGDEAVYTRTGRDGSDGKLVLSGNAWVNQNGNSFTGPELVLRDADKVVETTGRSTIVITNTGSTADTSDKGSSSSDNGSVPQGPVTAATPIAGRPEEAGAPLTTKDSK
ncbi:MAG: LptA/OstA family protein [Dialister sp.]|uniref:LptA/OstA family protein n=1 Tax=Dialister sp. TaxID=1955814 RepID=UPI002E782D40|nr:LptA/OstA family protein [Dialister sp.]MEE0292511.1 LptA/OstA family protein [Dialister sp.]